MNFTYNTSMFPAYTVYLYYDPKPPSPTDGVIKVRHMVKAADFGSYVQMGQQDVIVSPLPGTKTVTADTSYGKIIGSHMSYTAFVNGEYTVNSSSQTASLNSTRKTAYVMFYYQGSTEGGGNPNISGDFDVVPPKINYGDPFKLVPKNITVEGCTYQYHYFMISRDGIDSYSGNIYGMTTDASYTKSNYPYALGIGVHDVKMKIVTNCGESAWIGPKPLEVIGSPDNQPPQFQIGFVYPYEGLRTKPVHQVVVGEVMDLIYIDDPTVPTPYDPDGDTMYFEYFDFSDTGEWAKQIPVKYAYSKYTDGYHGIVMDTVGTYTVKGKMRDKAGATSIATTYIQVMPPNPVPIITGPSTVVEGRPLKTPFNAEKSYSPYANRTINHARDQWTNVKTKYDTVGDEIITLHVFDSEGLKSLQPATHRLTVVPDLAPIPQLNFTTPSIRTVGTVFEDTSYSPDDDKLVEHKVSYRYDRNNDSSFEEEEEVEVILDKDGEFILTPNRVGKYQFTVYVKEDWGLEATKTYEYEVVNDGPTVSFDISTESKEPVVIPSIPLYANNMVNLEGWKNYDLGGGKLKSWGANPSTGALGHSPSQIANFGDYIGPGINNIKSIDKSLSPNDNVVYLKDGYYVINYYTTYTSGASQWYPDRYQLFKDNSSVWWTPDNWWNAYRNSEKVDRYDPIEDRVYVRREVFNPSTGYSSWYPYVYTWNNFIYLNATNTAATVPAAQNGITSNNTPFGAVISEYVPNNITKQYNGDWATGTKGSLLTQERVRSLALSSGIYDAKMIRYVSFTANGATGGTTGLYSYNPATDDLKLVSTKVPSGHTLNVTRDGKHILATSPTSRAIKVYSTETGELTFDMSASNLALSRAYLEDNVFLFFPAGNAAVIAFKLTSEGTLNEIWREENLTNGIVFAGNSDSLGYTYFIKDKKIFRIKAATGNKTAIYDLSSVWRDSSGTGSDRTEISRSLSVGSGAIYYDQHYRSYYNGNLSSQGKRQVLVMSDVDYSNPKLGTQQQLLNSKAFQNIQFNLKLRFNDYPYDHLERYAGFSFHAQDHRNMYRVEMNIKGVRLVKIENGIRSVLGSAPYSINVRNVYPIRVQVLDGHIKVYINNVPLIDVADDTFEKGLFGPYSDIPRTEFLNMVYSDLTPISSSAKLQGIALVGEEMTYTITNDDLEKDPMIKAATNWRYDHLSQKFMDAGDGKSGRSEHDGNTYREPVMVMDKVGLYQVNYDTKDDANPDYLHPAAEFESYRKKSNRAARQLIVHRAPIADFDLGFNADWTIKWTDRSHDPDRYLSPTNYSKEETGIDYLATKGVLQKKFYYITPSGITVEQKLVTPEETGEYTVGLAVKDEYDAWSPYAVKKINVTRIPQPDEPPQAGFTLSHKQTYRGVEVTINSTARDKEDGARENLPHQYFIRNLTEFGFETMQSASRTSWKKTFHTMGTFQIRQVVEDKLGQNDEALDTIEIVNRIPVVQVTYPTSTDQLNPEKITITKPEFKWTYTDGDNDAMRRHQVRIYRYGGILEQESGILNGTALAWTPMEDLPEKVNLFVMVRTYDGYDWSEWSDPKFFYIETNQPPAAEFDWAPKPVYEGDLVQITHLIHDPDSDELTVQYRITDPAGERKMHASMSNVPYPTAGPSFKGVKPGIYQVELTVSDGKAPAVIVRKDIRVLPLTVAAQVKHTELWDERRKQFNLKASGNEESPRGYHVYWAGERFLLSAQTALTNTATKALRVEAAMGGFNVNLVSDGASAVSWAGEMWDESFEKLPDGEVTFIFTAVYSNGTVKSVPVTVTIAANVNSTVGVHRRQ
ncbi:hypothetical protein [Paenibacillus spongiae]|uniref:Uncharacterized protein n=1 Tax=Paenibacillus spongiae TaxID=2909671 RepID=A0ABY5S736_9BACL|nr:hypothetical protein [Paenibacillus spongiae]UVI28662.1 hypothetical protein L1F29_24935 [Paenibacillus spongiae]